MKKRMLLTAVLFAAAWSAPAQAQSFAAWHGCWRASGAVAGDMTCVLPSDEALSARVVTVVGHSVREELVLRADNVARPVNEGGCTGTETAFFSEDGRRVFTRADLECTGRKRVSTGVMALLTEKEWLDAQAVTVGDQHSARAMRYRTVSRSEMPASIAAALPTNLALAEEAARVHATAPLTEANVLEAARAVAPPVVEALLAARQHGFDLTARKLALLKQQGVETSTIDVMIALSYPARFVVKERVASVDQRRDDYCDRYSMRDRVSYARRMDAYGGCDRYSYYDSMYYGSSYGWSPWGYDPHRYDRGPIVVITEPDGGDVVKGRGYTSTGTTRVGSAQPRGSDGSMGAAGATSRGTTTTGSASGSSGTSTSSGDTGRTAKPRGGG